MMKKKLFLLFFCGLIYGIGGCSLINNFRATPTPVFTATPEATNTPEATLTPTPPPSAAIVNGLYLWQEDFDAQVENLRGAFQETGKEMPSEADLKKQALNMLIDELLFVSEARTLGISVSMQAVDERIQALMDKIGGAEALNNWRNANRYSEDGFRRAMERTLLIDEVKKRIIQEKMAGIEQVHAYQIHTRTKAGALEAKQNLDYGYKFSTVAKKYHPETGGDMNWIPRGIMYYEELENALFALSPGTYSDIIETKIGYFILFCADKKTGAPVDEQIQAEVERLIIATWLSEKRNNATIESSLHF